MRLKGGRGGRWFYCYRCNTFSRLYAWYTSGRHNNAHCAVCGKWATDAGNWTPDTQPQVPR